MVLIQQLSESPSAALAQARGLGAKLLEVFRTPFLLEGQSYKCTASIGITLFGDHKQSTEDLLKQADLALYQAKAAGRAAMRFFDPVMQAAAKARGVLDAELRRGLIHDEFLLHYQPQVNRDGRVLGAEALVRWQHPERGLVSPGDFLPFAEEKGLIGSIGHWVLKTACRQLEQWSSDPDLSYLTLAVNVSAHELIHPDFVVQTLRTIDRFSVDPAKLVLEFTETVMLSPIQAILGKMRTLKDRGVQFALDDFGVGYSSLVYLQSLPLDQLKIDRSFVQNLPASTNDAAITRSVTALGHGLGLAVIAEGVETTEQRDFLSGQGCTTYQGYLFGRPSTAEVFVSTTRQSMGHL